MADGTIVMVKVDEGMEGRMKEEKDEREGEGVE